MENSLYFNARIKNYRKAKLNTRNENHWSLGNRVEINVTIYVEDGFF